MIDNELGRLKYDIISRYADTFPILAGNYRRDVLWTVPVANVNAGITDVLVEKVMLSYNMYDVATGALIPNNETSLMAYVNSTIAFNRTPAVTTVEDKQFSMFMGGDSCKMADCGILWSPHMADFAMYFTAATVNVAGAANTLVSWSCILYCSLVR